MRGKRFSYRPKRIHRRQERDTFRHHIMPITYLLAVVGAVGVGGILLHYSVASQWLGTEFGLFFFLAILPLVFLVIRFVRGHFNDDLDEP